MKTPIIEDENSGLRNKVIKGTTWNFFSQICDQGLSLVVTIILARILYPSDFGIVALSVVFVGLMELFQNLGMGSAIIQKKNIGDDYLSTSFWTGIFTGICIAVILIIISPFAANFYKKEILKYIIIVSSAGFLVGPFTSIHITILTKKLDFRKIAFIKISTKVISGIISVCLALSGSGIWSLVLGSLVAQTLMTPIIWHIVKWRPSLIFSRKCFKDLFSFSSNILAFDFFNYFARNFDNLIIGKILGAKSLGYYSIAYNLMLKPLQHISWAITRVLFPAFSSIQDEKERVRDIYIKVIRSISLITFPMMGGLMVVSNEIILTFYGPNWAPVIILVQLLCIVGAMQSIGTTVGTIFTSQGRPDLLLKTGLVSSVIDVLAFIIGIRWSLNGLIIGYIIATVFTSILCQYFANKLISLKLLSFFRALAPAALCTLFMISGLMLFKYLNIKVLQMNIVMTLILSIVLGIIFYIILLFSVFKIPEVEEVMKWLKVK